MGSWGFDSPWRLASRITLKCGETQKLQHSTEVYRAAFMSIHSSCTKQRLTRAFLSYSLEVHLRANEGKGGMAFLAWRCTAVTPFKFEEELVLCVCIRLHTLCVCVCVWFLSFSCPSLLCRDASKLSVGCWLLSVKRVNTVALWCCQVIASLLVQQHDIATLMQPIAWV